MCGVPEWGPCPRSLQSAAFSLDWLLARSRRRTAATANWRIPFARCCMPTNCTRKPHKKVI